MSPSTLRGDFELEDDGGGGADELHDARTSRQGMAIASMTTERRPRTELTGPFGSRASLRLVTGPTLSTASGAVSSCAAGVRSDMTLGTVVGCRHSDARCYVELLLRCGRNFPESALRS